MFNIFNIFRKKSKSEIANQMTWFELQICPLRYRFAVVPNQPILIGIEGKNGEGVMTMLMKYEHIPEECQHTVDSLDKIVQESKIFDLPMSRPELAFAQSTMSDESVHIRIAYPNNRSWASYYQIMKIPSTISKLIKDSEVLARQLFQEHSSEKIDGYTALDHLNSKAEESSHHGDKIALKVKIPSDGQIFINEKIVRFENLSEFLDNPKNKDGVILYSRENPDDEPSPECKKVIEAVLNLVIDRKLPIKMVEN